MSKVILKFDADWCDEFQCQEFVVLADVAKAKEYIQELIENIDEGGEAGFGTNQSFCELEPGNFEIIVISDEDYEVLHRLFGRDFSLDVQFGTGIL
jgi:hypothetical protein